MPGRRVNSNPYFCKVKPQQESVKKMVEIPESLYELFRTEETGMLLTGKSETLSGFTWQAGFGIKRGFTANEAEPVFENLKSFIPAESIVFGHFCYDVKNSIEKLSSAHYSGLDFPGAFF